MLYILRRTVFLQTSLLVPTQYSENISN